MTDFHDLIHRMAAELDHYRQLVTDDRREVHPLAVEARAVLSADGPAVQSREPASVTQQPTSPAPANPIRDALEQLVWIDSYSAACAARAALSADGPAVPNGREPASVVGEPSDQELLELIPETMRDEFSYAAKACSDATGSQVKPRIFRVCLNTAALEYARAVLARWGRPAPVPAGEVGELVAWLRMQGEAQKPGPNSLLSGRTKNERHAAGMKLTRAADLLECLTVSAPVPFCERNWDSILSPSGGYEMADDAALRDGAQLVNGEWWAPVFGCDSLESALDRIRERLEHQAAPVPVAVSERLPGVRDCAPWPGESDVSAWYWVGSDVDGGWSWEQRSAGCLAAFPDDFTHWLPAHALPLPSGEVEA